MVFRRNHKLSLSEIKSAALEKATSKEIYHRWKLPLTIESLQNIKNAGVLPLRVAEQFSINEKGGRYIKKRMTRYFSFPGPSGLYVKNQVQRESIQPFFYGLCLLRILHMISEMLNKWPKK